MDSHDIENFDLFNPYPYSPGHRNVDTSIAAAAEIAPTFGRMQGMVRDAIAEAGASGLTSDEVAQRTPINKYTVRARTAELRRLGVIVDSKQRRLNDSGQREVIVWTLPEFAKSEGGGE